MKTQILTKTILFAFAICIFANTSIADVINIPGDQPTIQQGIDAANTGDTVLVAPATYIENINFNGKNITVASHFLTTQYPSYIAQTVIDGDSAWNAVINFESGEDSTAVLCGFSITNGYYYQGGGIHCKNSSPTIKNLIVKDNVAIRGGGVYIENSTVHIIETDIIYNRAIKYPDGSTQPDASGGGIRCYEASPVLIDVNISNNVTMAPGGYAVGGGISSYSSAMVLENVRITDNIALPRLTPSSSQSSSGGGINCSGSMYLSNVTIARNYAKRGGGINGNPNIVFDTINRCNIYMNKADLGNDFYGSIPEVIVDTFSVLHPTGFHAYPPENFSFDINTGYLEQEETDLYVSPLGDNSNSGLSADEPLMNTWCAFSKILVDSLHPHTIHLLEGIYSEENNEEIFPFRIQDYISLSGESQENVILDADSNSNVIVLDYVKDITIAGLTITGGSAVKGGGIESNFSTVLLQNLTIKGNSTFWSFDGGGGIYCNNSLLELQNITIKENISDKGGGIFVAASNPVIQNCTIDSNYATYGGGIYCSEGAIPVLKNTTIKNNTASEMGGGLYNDQSAPGFDETNRSNIYLNNALYGNDLYSDTTIHVVVDTFTVLNPTEFHAEPFQNFTFDILYGKVDQVDADLYVSPTGDNSNSGLTPDEPLKTIRYALSAILPDSISQNTVRLLDGTYSTSENGELFPINVPDNVNLQGISQNDVILDAEGQSGVMIIDNNTTNYIAGLTITGGITMYGSGISISNSSPTIQDVSIINNINDDYWSYGGGIYCSYSNPSLQNVNISNNSANTGGGIYCSFSNPQLQDVNISNNSTYSYGGAGGGIFCYNSDPLLQGVIISENSSKNGGGIYCDESNPVIENTDIINNTANGYQDTGGGGICCINSNPVLQGVNILNNTAYAFAIKGGGGICCINSNPTLSEVIISGNLSTNGGGIYLENSSPEMQNVTISNNSTDANNTEDIGGGGICCKSSSPLLQNVQITSNFSDRDGGGMVCSLNSSPTFIDVTITDNSTNEYAERKGGGIYCVNSSTDFENVLIQGNYAPMGGGFYFSSTSTQEFELVTIKNNSATKGGGIYCSSSDIEFHHTNRSNIYFNNAVQGNDLFSDVLMEVVVDTFSVLYPTSYYAQPLENFTFDILNGKIELLDADLYVSPDGDNENSGLTAGDPLKNIWAAQAKILTDSLHPHTIHLLEGIYSSTENEEIFPINMMNFLSLSGESENNVILDAEGQAGVMLIENISNSSIEGITITGGNSNMGGGIYCNYSNPVFQNLIISNNIATGYGGKNGGGIYCKDSNPVFNNVFILENEAEYGGGIWCDHSSPVLNNVTISYNSASDIAGSGDCYGGGIACVNGSNPIFIGALISNNTTTGGWDGEGYGGGIYCDNSNPIIKNAFLLGNYAYDYGGGMHCHLNCSPLLINTQFTGNEAGDSGGGISCLYDCFPTLVNVTISDNSSDEVGGAIYAYVTSSPSIVNSILWNNSPHEIFGNSINITYSDVKDGWEGEGNIDADPLFTETGDHPFSLTDESPCVNTGTPDTTGLYLPDLDLAGNPRFYGGRIDMGAYENQNVMVCLESLESGVWSSEFEVRCYPNPFYNQTTIHFNQPNAGFANLSIHDITGKKILTLHSGFLQAGEHGFVWDAEGMPEGMYLLRLEKAGVTESRKLLLLK